jgi:LytS/YehU family sensor histidine kinase
MLLVGVAFYFLHQNVMVYISGLERKTLQSDVEINYLKQQLNPHFLLNALNNLYGVSLSSPQDVSDKILELSDLLKYQINTNKKDWTSLQDEQQFITQYMQYILWKSNGLQYTNNSLDNFINYKVTPMLFLPLLENAVKYSAQCVDPFIYLQWTYSPQKIELRIQNNFNPNKQNTGSTKIGIDNLKRRLALYHPENSLLLDTNQHIFTATLQLWNLSTVA